MPKGTSSAFICFIMAVETADIFEDEYEVVPEYDDEADNIRYRGKVFEI